MTLKSIFFVGLLSTVLVSCTNDPLDVDVSDVSVNIEFIDMDSIFVNSDSEKLVSSCKVFKSKIKDVYDYQLGHCLKIGNVPMWDLYDSIQGFLNHPYTIRLEKRIAQQFGNKSEMNERIKEGFKHLKYHFPKQEIPKHIVYLNSAFAGSAISMETDIAVGLDRYLGNHSDVIKELPPNEFYAWIKEAMNPQFLERDVIASWIMTNVVDQPIGGSLVENIIYWGKIIYFVEASYPDEDLNIIIRYSQEDYDWAIENELSYWEYLVNQKLLFKLDERTQMNMLKEGPFTPGLPKVGPDRLGQFLGWRMVRQYMENHSELPLNELLEKSYNSILQEYKTKE